MAIGPEVSQYEIPRSRGVPPVVQLLFFAGIVLIFFVGAVSIAYAGEFHLWPASDVIKVTLSGRF